VREIGVHDDHDVAVRRARAREHGARQAALAAAHEHRHGVTRRPRARAFRRPVVGVVVDDHHFERRQRVLQRKQPRE